MKRYGRFCHYANPLYCVCYGSIWQVAPCFGRPKDERGGRIRGRKHHVSIMLRKLHSASLPTAIFARNLPNEIWVARSRLLETRSLRDHLAELSTSQRVLPPHQLAPATGRLRLDVRQTSANTRVSRDFLPHRTISRYPGEIARRHRIIAGPAPTFVVAPPRSLALSEIAPHELTPRSLRPCCRACATAESGPEICVKSVRIALSFPPKTRLSVLWVNGF